MSKMKLVIIGNGMVGHRYIEDLVEKTDVQNMDITVFCEEPRVAYDRVHLSSYFSHHTADELSLVKEGFYDKHGINVLIGERAININRENKIVYSSTGREIQYDKLVLRVWPLGRRRGRRGRGAVCSAIASDTRMACIADPIPPATRRAWVWWPHAKRCRAI